MARYYDLQTAANKNEDGRIFTPTQPKLHFFYLAASNFPLEPPADRRLELLDEFIAYCKEHGLKYTRKSIERILSEPTSVDFCYRKSKHGCEVVESSDPTFKSEYALSGWSFLLEEK